MRIICETLYIYLFNQESPIEIKNLFFEGDLAKTGSSINKKHIVGDRKHKRRQN